MTDLDDPLDDRIRRAVATVVASAPPAPSLDDVAAPRLASVGGRGAGRPSPSRRLLAVAAAAAVLLAGAVAVVASRGGDDRGDRTLATGPPPVGALPVRYALKAWDLDLEITGVTDAIAGTDPRPVVLPAVAVYERSDAIVRIVEDPDAFPAEPGDDTAPTITAPGAPQSFDATSAPSWGAVATTLRGGPARIRTEPTGDALAAWFFVDGTLVQVDVFGLDEAGARRVVEDLVPGGVAGLAPPPDAGFRPTASAARTEQPAPLPAATSLRYRSRGGDGPPTVLLDTATAPVGREEVLLFAAGFHGRLEQYGGRTLLVASGLGDGADDELATFGEGGAAVSLQAPGPVEPYLDALGLLDPADWEVELDLLDRRILGEPVRSSIDVGGGATITAHERSDGHGTDWCLTVAGSASCRPGVTEAPGGGSDSGDRGAIGNGFSVLIDGHWWLFGGGPDIDRFEARVPGGEPDAGAPVGDTHRARSDGADWYAVAVGDDVVAVDLAVDVTDGSQSSGIIIRPGS